MLSFLMVWPTSSYSNQENLNSTSSHFPPFPVLGSRTFFFGVAATALLCAADFAVAEPLATAVPDPLPSPAPVGGVLGVVGSAATAPDN